MIADRVHLVALVGLVTLAVAGQPAPAMAKPLPAHEARLSLCIRQAAGGRAWLEKTLWGLRDKEAGWIGAEVPNSNGSHDLGPLQINSYWVPKLAVLTRRPEEQVRAWLINDPCFNVQAARWIFLTGLTLTRDYWKAVGVYHSPTAWRQRGYIASVATKLRARYGKAAFD